MPTPLLPSLKENKVAISRRGEWISESQNTINDLVDDLKVVVNSKTDINSIPDIWARPAMYEAVLADESHHLHAKFVAEWRGILAMIALREARGLKNIKLERFVVLDASELTGAEPKFEQVIAKLLPEKFKNFNTDKKTIMQIFTIDNKPLAFVWPGLLVCPAVGLSKVIVNNISWWQDRAINDPTDFLSDAEKALLKSWIGNAIKYLDVKETTLLGLLNSFREDLAVDDVDTRMEFGNRIGVEGAYKFIDYPVMPVVTEKCIEDSFVRLVNQKGTDAKTLLVIVPEMDKQWDLAANKIVVAGTATFDAVSNLCFGGKIFGANKKVINGLDIAQFNAELCSSEDFFTDKIGLCYGSDNRFSNSLISLPIRIDGADARVILPIKRKLLEYLHAEWLAEHVTVEVKEQPGGQTGSDIEVKLTLPLSGDKNERLIELSKIYHRADEEIKDYDYMPVVQIWPNFETVEENAWQVYYSFYDAPIGWQRRTFYAEPYWEDLKPRCIETTSTYAEIITGKIFPEAYICYSVAENASGDKKDEIGLILLKKPQKIQKSSSNKNCEIGIDFGTTNSIAYYAINDEEPNIIRFQNRLYSVVDWQADNVEELRRNFFSIIEQPDQNTTSIRSIFHTFIGKYDGELDEPLMRGNIYYLEGANTTAEDDGNIEGLHDDMKWSEDGTDNMIGFLMQFAMQCMAEVIVKGATNISWNYSYPSAFSVQQNEDMKRLWETHVLPSLHRISKLSVSEISNKTESVAMAEFFTKKMNAAVQRGIVCFDIGGGSTDIAIWQGDKKSGRRHQCSLKFAGRKILNNYLFNKKQNNSAILSLLRSNSDEYNAQLDRVNNADLSTFNMEIEALLKYYEKLIFNSLTSKSMNPDVATILRDITFALAGIFYYAGTVITYLRNNDEYDERVDLPNCYVGGNASKLLDWAGKGQFSKGVSDILIAALISGILKANPKDKIDTNAIRHKMPEVFKTSLPKQEVAYGLVCNSYITKDAEIADNTQNVDSWFDDIFGSVSDGENTSSESRKINDTVVAGEVFKINNHHTNNPVITKADFVEVDSIVKIDSNCPMFKDFVATFNKAAKRMGYTEINFTDADYANICDIVNQQLVDKHRNAIDKPEALDMEPLFIIVLEKALEKLSKK